MLKYKIPGPKQYPFIGSFFDFYSSGKASIGYKTIDIHDKYYKKYGSLYKIRLFNREVGFVKR